MCLASAFFVSKKQLIDINQTFARLFLHKNEEKTTTYQEILYLCRRNIGSAYSNVSTQNNKTKTTQQKQQSTNNATTTTRTRIINPIINFKN